MSFVKEKSVSVIIPCYNIKRYLPSLFACLDAQTYKNFRAIFVDDGSTDGAGEIIKEYCSKNDGIYVCTEQQGVSSARNVGLDAADGELITFVDADDYFCAEHVAHLVSLIEKFDADIAITSFKKAKERDGFRLKKTDFCQTEVFDGTDGTQEFLAQKTFDFSVWNKMYKTAHLKRNGIRFKDGVRYGEDYYFNYLCFSRAKTIAYSTAITYIYVQHSGSLVNSAFKGERLDVYYGLNAAVADAETDYPELLDYARSIRAAYSCEMLYYIKKYRYDNPCVVERIIDYMQADVKSYKFCTRAQLYRRLFIPLVPSAAKLAFCRLLKKPRNQALPQSLT